MLMQLYQVHYLEHFILIIQWITHNRKGNITMRLSPIELGLVIVVILALFGGTLIPKITKRIKKSKDALTEGVNEIKG